MRACTCTCIGVLISTTPSFASSLLATGRAAAQSEELANLRQQTSTFTNDVRFNNIRLGAEGVAAQKMGLLQFASTLHATQQQQVAGERPAAEGAAPTIKPFDAMAILSAMSGAATSSKGGPAARLGYGGEEGAQEWSRKEKKRKKRERERREEKKREKKERKEKQKQKKRAKINKLVEEKGMEYADAKNAVEAILSEGSGSEKDSDSESNARSSSS